VSSVELPGTPVGRQLQWWLHTLATGADGQTVDRVAAHYVGGDTNNQTDDEMHANWREMRGRLGADFRVTEIASTATDEMTVTATSGTDKLWTIEAKVEAEEPHRFTWLNVQRKRDFTVTVRDATEADGPALVDLEKRSPIMLGDTAMSFDRGHDYFASVRLMEDASVVLAEVDGVPAAVEWATCHPARIGGRDYKMTSYIHLRVLPEHQRKGLWGEVGRRLGEIYWEKSDCGYAWGSRDNAAVQHSFRERPKWGIGAVRVLIPVEEAKGPPAGRPATPDDAPTIVDILNTTHEREAMYFPYTVESLHARLERAPDLYTWRHVLMGDGAVIGVWPGGDKITVRYQRGDEMKESRRGLVLDYGFLPGAEDELERLLRAWCGELAASGHTELSIFSSEPSPGHDLLQRMAASTEHFDLWTPPIAEPPGTAEHGVYADQANF